MTSVITLASKPPRCRPWQIAVRWIRQWLRCYWRNYHRVEDRRFPIRFTNTRLGIVAGVGNLGAVTAVLECVLKFTVMHLWIVDLVHRSTRAVFAAPRYYTSIHVRGSAPAFTNTSHRHQYKTFHKHLWNSSFVMLLFIFVHPILAIIPVDIR